MVSSELLICHTRDQRSCYEFFNRISVKIYIYILIIFKKLVKI